MIVGTRPLCDWVIAILGLRNLIGCPDHRSAETILSPVYEFRTFTPPSGGIHRAVAPLLFYNVERIVIPNDTPLIHLNELPIGEVEILAKAVAECDQLMVKLHEAQTGIALPTVDPVATKAFLAAA